MTNNYVINNPCRPNIGRVSEIGVTSVITCVIHDKKIIVSQCKGLRF